MQTNVTDIITTNYDLLFEKAVEIPKTKIEFELSKELDKKFEKGYNFYTYSLAKDKKIWHIHGTVKNKNSIILGHKKYSENIGKMMEIFSDREKEKYSWIEIMMEKEIHIFGIALDSVEIDIWLLLNERARRKSNNKIYYYYPSTEKIKPEKYTDENFSLIIKRTKNVELENKLSLLESHSVEIIEINCNDYDEFYKIVFEKI